GEVLGRAERDEGPGPDHRGQADHDRVSQAEPSFERSRGGGHGAPFGGACTGAPTAPAAGAPRMPVRRGQPPSPDRTASVPWARPWPLSWPFPVPWSLPAPFPWPGPFPFPLPWPGWVGSQWGWPLPCPFPLPLPLPLPLP